MAGLFDDPNTYGMLSALGALGQTMQPSTLPKNTLGNLFQVAGAYGQGRQSAEQKMTADQLRQAQMQKLNTETARQKAQADQMEKFTQSMSVGKPAQQSQAYEPGPDEAQDDLNIAGMPGVAGAPAQAPAIPPQVAQLIMSMDPDEGTALIAKMMGVGVNNDPTSQMKNTLYRRQLVKQYGEGSPETKRFDAWVRAPQYLNTGGQFLQTDPASPTQPVPVAPTVLKPGERPSTKYDQAKAAKEGAGAGEREQKAKFDWPKLQADADEMLGLLDKLKTHPGMSGSIGATIGLKHIPGTKEADFDALHKQVLGKQFMEAYKTLKGGGQITEVEGLKATQAMARISDPKVSEKAFVEAVEEFAGIVRAGLARAAKDAKKPSPYAPKAPSATSAPASDPLGLFK